MNKKDRRQIAKILDNIAEQRAYFLKRIKEASGDEYQFSRGAYYATNSIFTYIDDIYDGQLVDLE